MQATFETPSVTSLLFDYLEEQSRIVYRNNPNAAIDDLHQLARLIVVIDNHEVNLDKKRKALLDTSLKVLEIYRFSSATIDRWEDHGLRSPTNRTFYIEHELDSEPDQGEAFEMPTNCSPLIIQRPA